MKRRNLLVALALACGLIISPMVAFANGNEKGGNGRANGSRAHRTEQKAASRKNSGKSSSKSEHKGFGAIRVSSPNQGNRRTGQSAAQPTRRGSGQTQASQPAKPTKPTQSAPRPGSSNKHSATRPGTTSKPTHPSINVRPTPPRPGSGSHTVKVPKRVPAGHGWGRPLPPPPPRPKHFAHRLPAFRPLLGLTFGSLLNAGLSALVNTGYNVVGSANDRIYLSNVAGFGLTWPQVTVYYDGGAMSGALYHYSSMSPGMSRYNSVYRALCNDYGQPVERSVSGGVTSVTWWGEEGYITLQYAPSAVSGTTIYVTDLIYGR